MKVLTQQNTVKRIPLTIDDVTLTYAGGMGLTPKSELATDKYIFGTKTAKFNIILWSGTERVDFEKTGVLTGAFGQPLKIELETGEFSAKDSGGTAWTIAQDDPLTISEQVGELGLICKALSATSDIIHGRVLQYVASPVKLVIVWNMYSEIVLT